MYFVCFFLSFLRRQGERRFQSFSLQSELEVADSSQQGLPVERAAIFLIRFVSLAETFVFASSISFGELETEKNMPTGGILRQILRLVSTLAVRNILACRLDVLMSASSSSHSKKASSRIENLKKFVEAGDDELEVRKDGLACT